MVLGSMVLLVTVRICNLLHALIERLHVTPEVYKRSEDKLHVLPQLVVYRTSFSFLSW